MSIGDGKIFSTEEEVMEYYRDDQDDNQVVIFEGVVYDVKEYMPSHPGGSEYIGNLLGNKIDQDFEEAEHTKFARKIFLDLPIRGRMKQELQHQNGSGEKTKEPVQSPGGPVIDKDYIENGEHFDEKPVLQFDYNKGMAWQIWTHDWQFEEYMQFINEPKHFVNPVRDLRLFDSDLIEPLSKCPWYTVLIFWLVYILQYVPYLGQDIKMEAFTIFLASQFFLFVEYMMHRFLFHGEQYWMQHVPKNSFFYLAHFMLHGIHHAFPQDKHRLVLPPVMGYFYYAAIFKQPFYYLIPTSMLPAWSIGFLMSLLMYDLTHYFIHHSNPPEGSYFKFMKSYHLMHHYKKGTEGFGISNKIWDKVFDTEIKNVRIKNHVKN